MQGLILLDKPEGVSSFGAVASVRRLFNQKRAGHTGTLDPFATGVLPILLGRATRLSSYVLEAEKSYTAEILLGVKTDTLDITGKILEENYVNLNNDDVEAVLPQFRGKIKQTPPMYSAVHVEGKRLYQLAREGKEVERPSREIEIFKLENKGLEGNLLTLDITCSKGTYIRVLAEDIGKALGCGATVKALRRTASAGFNIEECVTLEELKSNPEKYLLPADKTVAHFDEITVTKSQASRVLNGGELSLDRCDAKADDKALYRILYEGELIALGQVDLEKSSLMIKCVLREEKI